MTKKTEKKEVPKVVSLVALGNSKLAFFAESMIIGCSKGVADEVWVINKMGVLIKHDMLFRMDDMRTSYPCNSKRYEGGNADGNKSIHDTYDEFLKNHDKPIVTSKAYPEYPTAIDYPLEAVINTIGYSYFRTTPAYAAAFAIHIGVKQLRIYGCDFVYPNRYAAEAGRANMEFILGIGMTMGMEVWTPPTTTLLDSKAPTMEKMYGYRDPIEVMPDPEDKNRWKVYPRPDLGEKDRIEIAKKERVELQKLMTKYKEEVKHDLIEGKGITKDDIDQHEINKQVQQKLLDAPDRDSKGRFIKKKESQKGEEKCQVHNDTQKVLPT